MIKSHALINSYRFVLSSLIYILRAQSLFCVNNYYLIIITSIMTG